MKNAAAFLKKDEASQVRAPLNNWGGKVNPGLVPGERYDIDLIDYSKSRISKKTPGAPKYVASLLDRNTRKLWTENLQSKAAGTVTAAYKRLLDQAKEETEMEAMEITGDLEGAFRSAPFQAMLAERGTIWVQKTRIHERVLMLQRRLIPV